MSKITVNNIYSKGVLVALRMGAYEGRKKLSKEQLSSLPTEIVRGVHDLFTKEFKDQLRKIGNIDMLIRGSVKIRTVPFPIDSVYFLPNDKIEEIVNMIEDKRKVRQELIEEAVDAYENAIQKFALEYPDFYNRAKDSYPSKSQFRNRFYLKYQFVKIAPPDDDGKLSPEIYKKEMAKFKESVEEMKKEVLSIVASTLLETTEKLKKQCDGKLNQKTFNSLNKFFDQIDNTYADFIENKDLKAVIDNLKKNVLGVDAESLRKSSDFKKEFKEMISGVAESLKAIPDVPLKRALDF